MRDTSRNDRRSIEELRDVVVRRLRMFAQEANRRHHHAGRAASALKRLGVEKRLLHRMQAIAFDHGFDRRDGFRRRLRRVTQDRVAWLSIITQAPMALAAPNLAPVRPRS
jgi:hypothetical protein